MGIYVIGDIHGCYTQFTELRERIENNDADAVFILAGDIVGRGPEDEKILSWAYENITLNGKYQMVLGNHDDGFMEVFGMATLKLSIVWAKKRGIIIMRRPMSSGI